MDRAISRRDFLGGVSVAIGASLFPACARTGEPVVEVPSAYYTPAETGMRGSHPGSFEVAHATVQGRQWAAEKIDEHYARDLRAFLSAGGVLLAGTEGNFGPGGLGNTLHLELQKLVSLGLSPYEAIRTATSNAGRYLDKGDKVGFLEVGYAADLVLLSENPTNSVLALRSLDGVSVSGRWYGRDELHEIRQRLTMAAEN